MNMRKRKSATERKEEIIDATLRLAGEIGPDRLTTEDLAREIGISQPGIFRHFPTKSAIWDAVGRHIGTLLKAKMALTQKRDNLPIDNLKKFVIGHLAFIETTPAIPAILFSRELHAENDQLRSFFESLIASRHKHFSELIQAEINAGRFKRSLDADDAAYLVLALIQGLAMRWSLNNRDFDLPAEGQRLLDLQIEGFMVAKSPQKAGTKDGNGGSNE